MENATEIAGRLCAIETMLEILLAQMVRANALPLAVINDACRIADEHARAAPSAIRERYADAELFLRAIIDDALPDIMPDPDGAGSGVH